MPELSTAVTGPRHAGGTTTAHDSDDRDVFDEIVRSGHPFILVKIGGGAHRQPQVITCKTQNDGDAFLVNLTTVPGFENFRLVRGLERALVGEIYEAADAFFDWMMTTDDTVHETLHVLEPDERIVRARYNYPAYGLDCETSPRGAKARATMLTSAWAAYLAAQGNDATRYRIIEALAFALSRGWGVLGEFDLALACVDGAMILLPYSIHLKAAKYALGLRLENKPVPSRLEKYIGFDNGYLKEFVCDVPFKRFDISPNGDALACCGHWLPTTIGNVMHSSVDEVLNSEQALKIRQSVTDGTYKYCNHLECGQMVRNVLPRRSEIDHPRTRQALASGDFHLDGVDELLFAFDQTCNLSCPSCRTHRITEKVSESDAKVHVVETKIRKLLPKLRVLYVNPAGELFASKISRRLLSLINRDECPDLHLDIISNGTLFSEEEWNKFPGIHEMVKSIRISTDAATKSTFEKLRRLGNYEIFLQNVRFISKLRKNGVINNLRFSFTYQLDNFREMPAFVDFCEEMGADIAIFERLQNIAFTRAEYHEKAVHFPDHPLYGSFIEIIKSPVLRTGKVSSDFNYDGVESLSREELSGRWVDLNHTGQLARTTAGI